MSWDPKSIAFHASLTFGVAVIFFMWVMLMYNCVVDGGLVR